MPDLLLELHSEEVPARMLRRATRDLSALVSQALSEAGLTFEGTYASATPRRLVLHVRGIPATAPDKVEERRGPRVGAPEKAIEGFVKASGLTSIAEAEIVSDPRKGDYYLARIRRTGRGAGEILSETLPKVVTSFPWPKSMRWGEASATGTSLHWVRPLRSIVCTFGPETEEPEVLELAIDGVPVGDVTHGHRFMAPQPIRVRRLDDYVAALKAAKVLVDLDRRKDVILHDARDRALALGCELVEDEALLEEVAGLVEWPVVLVGRFDREFLALPDEVIRLTIRENQKCFVLRDQSTGRLAGSFVLVANVEAPDGGRRIVEGNERVVRARLADARFFLETDMRVPLAEHARKLAAVTFHERIGSQADRIERIARLAREIAPAAGAASERAETAARLSKADLVTGLVGEFPELQGYVGRHYAEAEGYAPDVAAALEEHYRPLGPADRVPSDPTAVTLALADKLDTLVAFWVVDEKPTGSKDPYALRRAALGVIRIVLANRIRLPLVGTHEQPGPLPFARWELLTQLTAGAGGAAARAPREPQYPDDSMLGDLLGFMLERLKVQLRQEGARHDLVDAVLELDHHGDLLRIVDRVEALERFLSGADGRNLLQGFRRAANILRAEERREGRAFSGEVDRALLREPAEVALADAIESARSKVTAAIRSDDYERALAALAALRAPVDRFFEEILVNADDPAVRKNRLNLVAGIPAITRTLADLSRVEG